ncbi:MAG TPA: ATP-binding cassette domain-containing protein [Archaeoglobus sp.]|nr:ATP-binding cassette domain-containing protein [Archaeoglobus sp.]
MENQALLRVRNVKKYFPISKGFLSKSQKYLRAVDGVSFDVPKGGTLGIVGESGSGKTTLARIILRLIEPTSGAVYFKNQNIFMLNKNQMRRLRSQMQMIFQDPMASLNPRKTVKQTLEQVFKLHTSLSNEEIYDRIVKLLETLDLTPAELFLKRYPHELSGGQRQRVCIARAIALHPTLLIADEPVSALDVSVRGQIVNLLMRIYEEHAREMAYIIISHDISLVNHMCKDILVMYLGRIVEKGEVSEVIRSPLHPYTQMLISAIPVPDPEVTRARKRMVITGEVPSPLNPPTGCHFHPRCPYATEKCRMEVPSEIKVGKRSVFCHLYA